MNRARCLELARKARRNLDAAAANGIPPAIAPAAAKADKDLQTWESFLVDDTTPDELGFLPFLPILWTAAAAGAVIGIVALERWTRDIRESATENTRQVFQATSKAISFGVFGLIGIGLYQFATRRRG